MKPTLKCKQKYIIINYYDDNRIPSALSISNRHRLPTGSALISDVMELVFNKTNKQEIIEDILKPTPNWSCNNCIHQFTYKLTNECNETHSKM